MNAQRTGPRRALINAREATKQLEMHISYYWPYAGMNIPGPAFRIETADWPQAGPACILAALILDAYHRARLADDRRMADSEHAVIQTRAVEAVLGQRSTQRA